MTTPIRTDANVYTLPALKLDAFHKLLSNVASRMGMNARTPQTSGITLPS